MAWNELWSVSRLGSKVGASISPDGDEVGIGITNLLARTGVANRVTLAEARELALALLRISGGPPSEDSGEALMAVSYADARRAEGGRA